MTESNPIRRVLGAALALALVAAGCGVSATDRSSSGGGDPAVTTTSVVIPDHDPREQADALDTWTVFVYLAADNNLEAEALADIEEMSEAANTRFLVLLDRSPDFSSGEVADLGDFDGTAWLDIQDGEIEAHEVDEVNTGDPETLAAFLADGYEAAPDGHHALVVWNHGGGWRGAAWDDSTDGDRLEVAELASGIADGLERAGVDALDLIGFDACNMATYEVAASLAPHAAYLLASEETEPGTGWNWTDLATPAHGTTTRDLAAAVIDGYVGENDSSGSTDTTLSLLDLTQVPLLHEATNDLLDALRGDGAEQVGRIGAARASAQSFARHANPAQDFHLVDLGDLADQLRQVEATRDVAVTFGHAIDQVVVHTSAGPAYPRASGIAAYFPPNSEVADAAYQEAALTPAWTDVLVAFYQAAQAVDGADLPLFTDPDRLFEDEDVIAADDGLTLEAEVQAGGGAMVTDAGIRWGEVDLDDANLVTWFGRRNATVDGDRLRGTYDWTVLELTVDGVTSTAYAQEHVDERGEIDLIEVPVRIHEDSDTFDGNLVITLAKGRTHTRFVIESVSGAYAELTPTAGQTFTPLLARQDLTTFDTTWIPTLAAGERFDATAPIEHAYVRLEAMAPIMAGLNLIDITGNEDTMYYGTASP